jgi:hypothetical protein
LRRKKDPPFIACTTLVAVAASRGVGMIRVLATMKVLANDPATPRYWGISGGRIE